MICHIGASQNAIDIALELLRLFMDTWPPSSSMLTSFSYSVESGSVSSSSSSCQTNSWQPMMQLLYNPQVYL